MHGWCTAMRAKHFDLKAIGGLGRVVVCLLVDLSVWRKLRLDA